MTERKLYLVRHGQRLDAVDKQWHAKQGGDKYDSPLSSTGIMQAEQLARRLQDEAIDVIISSPYLRALQTAQPIAEALGMPFYVDAGMGEWQGRAMIPHAPDITPPDERVSQFANLDLSHTTTIWPQYPESVPQVFARYRQAVTRLLDVFDGHLLIVGHGRVVTGTAHVLVGKPEREFNYPIAGITRLVQTGDTWQIDLNGDDRHLQDTPQVHYV
jgi:broad specificity phosphatase PhoE